MYRQFNIQQFYVLPTQYICVLCGSQNKQPLFPYTTLTDWFYNRDLKLYSPVVAICTTSLIFNNSTFCPYLVFMYFAWISEQRLLPYAALTDCFYNRDLTLYSPVVTIYTASLTFNYSTFCPQTVFMCFMWISKQTAIIFLNNLN